MNSFVTLVVVFAAIAAGLLLLFKLKLNKGGSDDGPWPFYAVKAMSAPEQVLYHRLCKTLPDNLVLAQVGLSRFLRVKKGNNFQQWFNRINRMSADFVVCAKDASVLAVIELDDSSHEGQQHRTADAKKDKALAAAGIRIVRWSVKSMPDDAAIKATFKN